MPSPQCHRAAGVCSLRPGCFDRLDQFTQLPLVVWFHLNKLHPKFLAIRPSDDRKGYVEGMVKPGYVNQHARMIIPENGVISKLE